MNGVILDSLLLHWLKLETLYLQQRVSIQNPTLLLTTEIALATYGESFLFNNPLISRNNDYDGSPYFEFVR